jgi:NADH:ubiquinone oxidoreductase subunit 5 (subunit L)/multisubunit Na+/H+ antiporter MnhA subunit
MLAASSISQISYIFLALSLGTSVGVYGGIFHLVNHALMKTLLFLCAGALMFATGTRAISEMGGLSRKMPVTAVLFLVGAAAISGLPPFNGFASEWLVFMASLRAVLGAGGTVPLAASSLPLAGLAAPALALVGGLAAACFAKVFGTVFLGHPRSAHAERGHEAPATMLVPMAVLALGCLAIGFVPAAWLPGLTAAAGEWARLPPELLAGTASETVGAAWRVSLVGLVLLVLVGLLVAGRRPRHGGEQPTPPPRGCGDAHPTARMQYTGSSFAESLVLRFGWVFFARKRVELPAGPFPRRASFDSHVPDTVLDLAILPALAQGVWMADRLRSRFGGRVQSHVLLVIVGILALLAWLAFR